MAGGPTGDMLDSQSQVGGATIRIVGVAPSRASAPAASNVAMNVLRVVISIIVVCNHVRPLMFQNYADVPHTPLSTPLYALSTMGRPCLLVFFALSGLWVGGSVLDAVLKRNFSWRRYGIQRITRLWLVLLPVLLIVTIADTVGRKVFSDSTIYTGSASYSGPVPLNLSEHLGVVPLLSNILFLQDIHAPTYGTNSPLWSLAQEFWFYVLFPLFVLLMTRGESWLMRGAASAAVAAVAALVVTPQLVAFFAVFVMGAVMSRFPPPPIFRGRAALTLAGGATTATAMFVFRAGGLAQDVTVGVIATAFVWALRTDFTPPGRRTAAVWRGLGDYGEKSTYSLYLIHVPLLALVAAWAVPQARGRWIVGPATALAAIGVVTLLLIAGFLLSVVTERRTTPVRRWVDRVVPGGSRPGIAVPRLRVAHTDAPVVQAPGVPPK